MNLNHSIITSFVLIILAGIIIGLFIMPAFGNMESTNHNVEEVEEVYVGPGDTLWEIAKKYGPKTQDIRKTIYEIKEYNNLQDSYIYQGQILKVPIKK